jgi:hypothetical protein
MKAPVGSPVTTLSRRSQVPSASIHFRLILKFVSLGFEKNSYCIIPSLAVDWSERRRSSQNAVAFRSCGEYSRKLIQRPAGDSGLWRPRRRSRGGSTIAPRKAKPFVEINSDFHHQHTLRIIHHTSDDGQFSLKSPTKCPLAYPHS